MWAPVQEFPEYRNTSFPFLLILLCDYFFQTVQVHLYCLLLSLFFFFLTMRMIAVCLLHCKGCVQVGVAPMCPANPGSWSSAFSRAPCSRSSSAVVVPAPHHPLALLSLSSCSETPALSRSALFPPHAFQTALLFSPHQFPFLGLIP